MQFNLIYDAAALAAPASFRAGIQQAATLLDAAISNAITVNIMIDYSGTGGGAVGGPDNGLNESYSTIRADLIKNTTPGDTTFNALPTGLSIQGQSQVVVWNAELKCFGLLAPNDATTDDGSCSFNTDIAPNSLIATALHELTHAMGRVPNGPQPDIFDFFRFTTPGTYLFSNANTAPPAYFSVDGGITKLADYGQTSDPSDFLNTGVQGNDPFTEFGSANDLQQLTTVDLKQLDALGFNTTSAVPATVAATSVQQEILGLYAALYNRAAEFPGYNYWTGIVAAQSDASGVTNSNAGTTAVTLNDAAVLGQDFVNTQATFFNQIYASLTDSNFINALYVNIGGNAGDPSGIAYWAGLLQMAETGTPASAGVAAVPAESVQAARAGLVGQFVHDLVDFNLAAAASGLTAAQLLAATQRQGTINDKIAVSLAYSNASQGPGGAILDPQTIGDAAFVAATTIIQNVTYDPTTVTTAITGINAAVTGQNLHLI
jgi:hypothetical protein